MTNNPHIGSSFDEFLEEEGILEEVRITALKRVLVWQLQQEMQKQGLTKSQMATAMGTSRASLNRLLDPDNTAVTLKTLERAAAIVGKRLYITLLDPEDLATTAPA
ncbi:MAG: helix-turn-helix domain-containing protein [Prochlorothrix sp.]